MPQQAGCVDETSATTHTAFLQDNGIEFLWSSYEKHAQYEQERNTHFMGLSEIGTPTGRYVIPVPFLSMHTSLI